MDTVLIVDTETTGVDAKNNHIIEVAAILYSVKHKNIIQQLSTLIPCASNEAEHINKISAELSQEVSTYSTLLAALEQMSYGADAIVAHNAQFDKGFINQHIEFNKEATWICTYRQFKWPVESSSKKLTDIAMALGIPVVSAHRALTDCSLLSSCFDKIPDLEERLHDCLLPRTLYAAKVGFSNKQLAKDAGFAWCGDRRIWTKFFSEDEAKNTKLPFPIMKVA